MSPTENRPAHLEPSELGTKEYWDKLYTNELSNHAADPSDIGTVWFDDSDAEAKVVDFLGGLADDGALDRAATTLLDLGCGNGSLLFALRDDGWAGRALGVDYSPQSVALARQVAASRDADAAAAVGFREWDIIGGPVDAALPDGGEGEGEGEGDDAQGRKKRWDVVLDKGTFDAISLSDERDAQGRRLCEGYRGRVLALLRPGGLFLVTSCNWTEEELTAWFVRATDDDGDGGAFEVAGKVQYRTFSFGGAKGQTISTMCFRKL